MLHNALLGVASRHHAAVTQVLAAAVGDRTLEVREGGEGGVHRRIASLVRSSALLGEFLKWVRGLPGGLHTQVGQGGVSLSIGERQLLSIVRALLQLPGVLALDLTACALGEGGVLALKRDLQQGQPLAQCSVLLVASSQLMAEQLEVQAASISHA